MQHNTYTVYLADDDEDDRQFLVDAFIELPQTVTVMTFDNGAELIDTLMKMESPLPEMIFLDLFMPLRNGEECLVDIRAEPKLSDIPVVIYSTLLDLQKAEQLRQKGANMYLRKPSSFDELENTLAQCMRFIDDTGGKPENMMDFIIQ